MEDPDSVPEIIQELLRKSNEAKENSFCPYSKFRVGAAILTDDGKIITGCNVENASYTLGICAERCAIFKAVSEGHRKFKAIAISTDVKDLYAAPCGACRQIIYEFGGSDIEMYMARPDHSFLKTTSLEVLPHAFGPEELFMEKVKKPVNGEVDENKNTEPLH